MLLKRLILLATFILFIGCNDSGEINVEENHPPEVFGIDASALAVVPGGEVHLKVNADDPDGDPLTYYWSATGGYFTVMNEVETDWTAPNDEGIYSIYTEVTDDRGASDSDSVNIEVSFEINEDYDGDGYTASEGDCDDTDATIYPDAPELCDSKDNDCDEEVDEGCNVDSDGDGFTPDEGDCNDSDSSIYPGAEEIPYDGIDQDCSGADANDLDGDGYIAIEAGGDDCDDGDNGVYPDAYETPYDGVDQDCDGLDLTDVDGDGYDAEEAGGDDCNDEDNTIYPGADEISLDGIDQDCNGVDDCIIEVPDDYSTIQGAIDASPEDCEIRVQSGTYVENIEISTSGISIIGVDGAESTIVDGNNIDSVFIIDNGTIDVVIQGFTIRNGYQEYENGGGILCDEDSSVFIENNIIENNYAYQYGGGIYCAYGTEITVNNNIIIENEAIIAGGGICSFGSYSISIYNNIISNNISQGTWWSGGSGGGVDIWSEFGSLWNNIITGNYAYINGGGVQGGGVSYPISIVNNVIAGNESDHGEGGGIYTGGDADTLIFNNIIISNVSLLGGGIYSPVYVPSISYNDIISNTPDNFGGSSVSQEGINGNISQDPQFYQFINNDNYEDDDFHLLSSSPCIDSGNPISIYNDTDGTRNDMGIYGGPYGNNW